MTRSVLAVVVSRDGAQFLPRTLDALRGQTVSPDRTIGVDVGSRDSTRAMLASLGGRTVTSAATVPFGRALELALEGDDGDEEWLWVLHDDVAPEPEALEELLAAAGGSDSLAVLGPKLLGWDDEDRLLEVGLTLGSDGSRHTGVTPGDIDQGQWDDAEDVLAVNSAGMLVRREVFTTLGGFAPILSTGYDDIEFCRRVRLAGHRVRVVPSAKAHHAEAATRGLRGPASRPRQRLADMWTTRILGSGRGRSVPTWVLVTLLGVLRGLYRLVAKEPGAAVEEFAAVGALPDRMAKVWEFRRRTRAHLTRPASILGPLLADRRATRAAGRAHEDPEGPAADHRRESPVNTGGVVDSYSPLDPLGAPRRRLWTHPVFLVLALLTLVSAVSQFRLVGPGAPVGGALLSTAVGPGELFTAATAGWQSFGLGHAVPGDPLFLPLWVLSLLFLGNTGVAVAVLWLLALPLAAGSAVLAAGALTPRPWLRAAAGLVWALAPTLLLSLDDGRLGAVLSHLALPMVALGLVRARGAARSIRRGLAPGRGGVASHTAGAGAGLAAAVVAAGTPVLTLPLLVVGAVAAVTAGRGRRLPHLWFALAIVALALPWLIGALRAWPALLSDPGALRGADAGPAWQLLLLHPGALEGLGFLGPVAVVGQWVVLLAAAPLLVVGLLALVRGDNAPLAWPVALLIGGLVVALLSAGIVAGADATALVAGYAGAGTSVMLLALLWLAGETLVPAGRYERPGRHRPFALAGTVLGGVTVAGLVVSGGLWSFGHVTGERGEVVRSQTPPLPALATDRYEGPLRQSTLVLRVDGDEIIGEVRGPRGGTLVATSTLVAADAVEGAPGAQVPRGLDDAQRTLGSAVATVTAGSGHDSSAALRDLGIGFVVIDARQGEDTTSDALARNLDVAGGLDRLGETSSGTMWTVEGDGDAAPAYAVLVEADGTRVPLDIEGNSVAVPSGTGERTLYLAQRADDGWRASLDLRVLEPGQGSGDWRQSWALPEEGGTLSLEYRPFTTGLLAIGRGIALIVVVFVAIPLRPRPQGGVVRAPAAPAPRSETP